MPLSGSLEDVSIIDVLQIVGMAGKSGVLHVEREGQKVEISFNKGKIVGANTIPRSAYLIEILEEKKYLSPDGLEHLKALQATEGQKLPLGNMLLQVGGVSFQQIDDA